MDIKISVTLPAIATVWLPLPQYSSRRSILGPKGSPFPSLKLHAESLLSSMVDWFTAAHIQSNAFSLTWPLGLLKAPSTCTYDSFLPSDKCKTSFTWFVFTTIQTPAHLPIIPKFFTPKILESIDVIDKLIMFKN